MQSETRSHRSKFVRLELTPEQRAQMRDSLGVETDSLELGAKELEDRIAPLFVACANGEHFRTAVITS